MNLMIEQIDQYELERACEECGSPIRGRADKTFCRDACRKKYKRDQEVIEDCATAMVTIMEENEVAREVICVGALSRTQSELVRNACRINELLKARADKRPLVALSIQYNFERAVKKYLVAWEPSLLRRKGEPEYRFTDELQAVLDSLAMANND